jgi:tetratricopeptide (TPR) repeat protein
MLETIREYAQDRLAQAEEADQIARRHAEWMLTLGRPFASDVGTTRLQSELPQLRAEIDNARAAIAWALERAEPEFVLELILASWAFGPTFSDVARWYDEALPKIAASPSGILAHALRDAGAVAEARGELGKAAAFLTQSLSMHRELGDKDGETRALWRLGNNALAIGDVRRARATYEESLALATRRGDSRGAYRAVWGLGLVEQEVGDLQVAVELLEQSLALAQAEDDLWAAGRMLHSLGDLALDQHVTDHARMRYREAGSIGARIGDDHLVAYCLAGLAAVAALGKKAETAGRFWGAFQALEMSSGGWIVDYDRERYEKLVTAGTGEAPGAFELGVSAGQKLTLAAARGLAHGASDQTSEGVVEDDVVGSSSDATR